MGHLHGSPPPQVLNHWRMSTSAQPTIFFAISSFSTFWTEAKVFSKFSASSSIGTFHKTRVSYTQKSHKTLLNKWNSNDVFGERCKNLTPRTFHTFCIWQSFYLNFCQKCFKVQDPSTKSCIACFTCHLELKLQITFPTVLLKDLLPRYHITVGKSRSEEGILVTALSIILS